jgi:DNA recombination protein RmuC
MDTTIAFLLLALFCFIALFSLYYAWQQSQARVKAETELAAERRQSADKLATLQQTAQEAKTVLSDQFKNLANEILEEKSKRFAEQNQQNLDIILKPLPVFSSFN